MENAASGRGAKRHFGKLILRPRLKPKMHRQLRLCAAAVWFVGAVYLLTKSFVLAAAARAIQPDSSLPTILLGAGVVVGAVKAKLLFAPLCRKNLVRIFAIAQPRFWQFYRPVFFVLLALMISLGMTMTRMADGNFAGLVTVSAIDAMLGTALLLSGSVFFLFRQIAQE